MKNLMQQTQIEAYNSLKDIGRKQAQVYYAIQTLHEASDQDVAQYLKVPINTVTPRRNELFRLGAIKEAKRGLSKQTGKRVIFWKIMFNQMELPKVQKKKGHYYHTKCGEKMKKQIDMQEIDGRMKVKQTLICAVCDYKEDCLKGK